jgi:hypothetical protein
VSYQYGLQQSYIVNFSNLKQGTHPNNAVSLSTSNIEKIVFPIIPTFYVEGRNELTGRSDEVTVTFSNWTISGGNLGIFLALKKHILLEQLKATMMSITETLTGLFRQCITLDIEKSSTFMLVLLTITIKKEMQEHHLLTIKLKH